MATTSLDPVLRHIRQLMEITPSLADGELLERFVRQREEGAFEALMRRHGPMVLGVGRRVLHDRDAAADIFRATFLVLARHACSLNRRGSVAGWLYTVAYRLALKAKAEVRRRHRVEAGAARARASDPLAELTARAASTAPWRGRVASSPWLVPPDHGDPTTLCKTDFAGRSHNINR